MEGRIREEDMAELLRMRTALLARMEELDAQESYGLLPDGEKHRRMAQEFGPDYLHTLREINALLHRAPRRRPLVPHREGAAFALFLIAATAIVASLLYPGVTGAAVSALSGTLVLSPGESVRLPEDAPITITDLSVLYGGTEPFVLVVHDATAERTLLSGAGAETMCTGCGEPLRPPYLLELAQGDGQLRIARITYHRS